MWRTAPVPPAPGPTLHLYRLRKGANYHLAVLAPEIYGLFTHWTGRQTEPCTAPGGCCDGCNRHFPLRWKGYLHCRSLKDGGQGIVELTPGAARQITAQVEPGKPLRGLLLQLRRSQAASNGRLDAIVLGWHQQPHELPPAISPLPTLERLYTYAERSTETPTDTTLTNV